MGVYRLIPPETLFQFLIPADRQTAELLATLPQLDSNASLGPLPVKLITRNQGQELALTDFPWFESNVPAYSKRAFAVLEPLLGSHVRPFELRALTGETFVGLHVERVVDALDPDRSHLTLFPSSGRVMDIDRHVFISSRVRDTVLFRLPQFDRAGWIYASGRYVDAVAATGLETAAFDLVWTDGR